MPVRPARQALESALAQAVGRLGVASTPDLELARARVAEHGDYASPVAMKVARELRQAPPVIAARLANELEGLEEAAVEVAGPYLNFRLRPDWLWRLVAEAAAAPRFGSSWLGRGERIQVEFASVNPTGPLHIGHGRGVVLGDALCRLLEFTGHEVEREYYVNDQNTQARRFAASVFARLHGQEPPEGGYAADYVTALAGEAREALPGIAELDFEAAEPRLRDFAVGRMVELLDRSVRRLNVVYDHWYRESTLWAQGLPQRAIERLREGGHLKERAGALWFAPAVPGWEDEDEDRVVIRSSGEPTYFASDLGYLLSKFEERGFHRVIDVWGADHHGYVPRMKAAMACLGLRPDSLVVILNQMVNLREGKMSKRQGRFVTMDELVDAVGVDAVRYFYLMRSPDTMMDFDLELAVAQRGENPVYYAQYAHARLFNVEGAAAQAHPRLPGTPELGRLGSPGELALARQLALWPEVVEQAARLLEPHRIPHYVHELADRVHGFYHSGNDDPEARVVVADPDLTRARLELCRAARNTLRLALGLIGVGAPQRM